MSEPILMALVQLFAIIAASVRKNISENSRRIPESYLGQHLKAGELEEYLKLFDELVLFHQPEDENTSQEEILNKVEAICKRLRNQLTATERILVFIKFAEFTDELSLESDQLPAIQNPDFFILLEVFRTTFNIPETEFDEAVEFVSPTGSNPKSGNNTLVISASGENVSFSPRHIIRENLSGFIVVLYIPSVRIFICRYHGQDQLFLNGTGIYATRSFVLNNGSILKNQKINPVYYADVASQFLQTTEKIKVEFTAKEIEFRFKNSKNGIHPFSFTACSGELIGVMGSSGAGKSTLLNVLNGNLKLSGGEILINGYNIENEKDLLKGIIGFIPQDDLLIEELTVFRNLYFNAKLCFRDYTDEQLQEVTNRILSDIGLSEIRDLKVGDPINKFISGGQRKRLNIALELIRQPSVLFADEPTSGLSSMDSEMVMLLLKEQTIDGRLVIVNIHQPSSDIFKLFDKLLIIDKGGYPIWFGNPIDAITYFKRTTNHVNPDESECRSCGYVNPELLLQITESKIVNEYGKFTGNRKLSPEEWYGKFRDQIQPELPVKDCKSGIPESSFGIPGIFRQFMIFTQRNILSKITNRQYLLINFLEAPLLAILLAWITRFKQGSEYYFSENSNLVAYLFMSVVVALFLGMMVSAEEIIKDRKILKREEFLNLSRFSYLNSRIVFLFALSAIQSLLYVVSGNLILGIKGMMFSYWLVLFTTTCFANMVGLNISSGLNSVVAIYITIPFILVPQLLLSGTIVSFDKLNPVITNPENVPVIGNMMTSRWAFEALAVEQFRNNDWEKRFFEIDQKISRERYVTSYLIPELTSLLDESLRNKAINKDINLINNDLLIVNQELIALGITGNQHQSVFRLPLTFARIDDSTVNRIKSALDSLSTFHSGLMSRLISRHDDIYNELVKTSGQEAVYGMKQRFGNNSLSDLVKNVVSEKKIIRGGGKLIRKYEPVFMNPVSGSGNAHLYAPVKKVGTINIDTLVFNVMIIWLMTFLMYLTLWHDSLRKLLDFAGGIKIRR